MSDPAWNKTGPNMLSVLRIIYPSPSPSKKVINTKAIVNDVYGTMPLPATVWLNEKINACKRLETLGPNTDIYFFRKAPLYNSSSLIPLAMTMTSIQGNQSTTLSMLRF